MLEWTLKQTIGGRVKKSHSDNDQYVPMDKAQLFAETVKGKKVLINNTRHFYEKYE